MSLWAISDIHVSYKSNKDEFMKLKPRGPEDGLILAGDGAHILIRGKITQTRHADSCSGRIVEISQ